MLRITGRLADGWLPTKLAPNVYADSLATIRQASVEAGRDAEAVTPGLLAYVLAAPDEATLRRMIEALEPIGGRADWVGRAQQLVQEWRDDVAPRANSDAVPIIPERLCNEITKFLPSDAGWVSKKPTSTGSRGSVISSTVRPRE